MGGLRMLPCWHHTGLMLPFTFSSLDDRFSRCPEQLEGGFFRESSVTPVFCSPMLVLPAEFYSVLDVFLGHKWLCCPSWALSKRLCPDCVCRCTHSHTCCHLLTPSPRTDDISEIMLVGHFVPGSKKKSYIWVVWSSFFWPMKHFAIIHNASAQQYRKCKSTPQLKQQILQNSLSLPKRLATAVGACPAQTHNYI